MTRNQIEYWNMKETGRHNVATEVETNRHNVATEVETNRHNVRSENIDISKLNETIRHNKATEGQTDRSLAETNRHNLVTEGQTNVSLGYSGQTLDELKRHNMATEALQGTNLSIQAGQLEESVRHNVSTEGIQRYSAISQSTLNKSIADLNEVKRVWESLKSSSYVDLTSAQIKQLDNLSAKLSTEMDKIQVETKNAKYEGAFIIYEEFLRGMDSFSRAVDALVPG